MKDEVLPARRSQNQVWRAPSQDRFSAAESWHRQVDRYLASARKRWWIPLVSLALIGGPTAYYAKITPTVYQSKAFMWLSGRLNLPSQGMYTEELTSYIGTQAALLKSPTIQANALQRVRLKFPGLASSGSPGTGDDAASFDFSVRYSTKTSVLELRASGSMQDATRYFLDSVMEEYLAFKKGSRKRASSGALSGITEQIKEVEQQIKGQQEALTFFQNTNNVSFLTEHGLSAGSHLARLTEMLSDLQTEDRLLQMLSPEQFKSLSGASPITLSDRAVPGERAASALALNGAASQSAYYQALQQYQLLKARRDEFAKVLRPTHSKMVKLNQELSGLEQLLNTLQQEGEDQALQQMANRRKSLELQIQSLQGQYAMWETNAAAANRKLAEFERMKQDLQRSQALYDRLLGLVQTVDLNNSIEQEPLEPLAPASVARPTLVKLAILAGGLFLAMLVGFGSFFILDTFDDRFTSAKELSLQLPAEVIGQIPRTALGFADGRKALLTLGDEEPAFAESFRNLRSSLLFMPGGTAAPRVILVTSAVPKEGKSTVASNLALTLAMAGNRVLLVDADFRRGSLHRTFGTPMKPGLFEVLNDELPVEMAIRATGQFDLHILATGSGEKASSDILLRKGADRLLKELSQKFSHVIIDSAPVLATDDAACLGRYTDGVFLVIRASYTPSRMAEEAVGRLLRRQIKILGTIYNCAAPSSEYYSYYTRDYHDHEARGRKAKARASRPSAAEQRTVGEA